ncbi:MAG TPA: lysophospholipid acyltransferase family protein [Chitinispirillaceae bacterium]|nr:lysophospholipid acyltransferase family protein [Chitinispirillaceae bacterium]
MKINKLQSGAIGKQVRHDLLYKGAQIAFNIASKIPRSTGLSLFGRIGALVFLFPSLEKRRTISHLKFIYGNKWSEKQILSTAREVYIELGKNLFDAIHLSRLNQEALNRIVQHDSLDEFRSAYELNKGVIVITAHVGCFEMLLHFFALHGFKSFAVGRKMFDQRLEELIRETRSGDNIEYMDRTEGTIKIVRLLKQGKTFGVLIDQDTKVESVFAPFLGHDASTPSGPVKLAMKFDIPAFVVTTVRQKNNTHHVYISEQLKLTRTDDFESDLRVNVQKANDIICDTIRRYPSQWVWMHRRWKHKPPT